MNTNQAIATMNKMALTQGFEITQGVVYGNFSDRVENDVKVQDVTRIYEKSNGKKLTFCFDAATNEIYYFTSDFWE